MPEQKISGELLGRAATLLMHCISRGYCGINEVYAEFSIEEEVIRIRKNETDEIVIEEDYE